jgi:hypothetical protein
MAVSFPLQPEHTWRKLGYLYFTSSTDYRTVLEENPQWTVTELPPIGAQIRLSSNGGGQTSSLTQGSFIFSGSSETQSDEIFPFDTQEEYTTALYRYNLQGVVDRESLNGISFDSTQAISGDQTG